MLVTPGAYAYSLPEGIAPPQGFPASGHFWTPDANKPESLAVYEQLRMSGFKVDFHPAASIVEYAMQSGVPAHHVTIINNDAPPLRTASTAPPPPSHDPSGAGGAAPPLFLLVALPLQRIRSPMPPGPRRPPHST